MAADKKEYTDAEKAAYWRKTYQELRRKVGAGRGRSGAAKGRKTGGKGRYASAVTRRRTGKYAKGTKSTGRPGRREAFNGGYTRYKRKRGAGQGGRTGRPRSGCILYPEYKTKGENTTVKIFAWRYVGRVKQILNAHLGPNEGKPKSEAEGCRVFVCNLSSTLGKKVVSGVWSEQFDKLTITADGETLVAIPGRYFGPGGKRFAGKFNK